MREGSLHTLYTAGRVDLMVAVDAFTGTQYRGSAVDIAFRVELRDHATGRLLYRDGVRTTPVTAPTLHVPGALPPADLQVLEQATMSRAIDQTLDQPAFTAILRSLAAPAPA